MSNYDNFTDEEIKEVYEDDYFIVLTIEGTEFDKVEVKVNDPDKSISETISSIVQVFNLPKMDGGNNPIEYRLGRINDEGEAETLYPEDEDGLALTLNDYEIVAGDELQLVSIPIAG